MAMFFPFIDIVGTFGNTEVRDKKGSEFLSITALSVNIQSPSQRTIVPGN